QLRLVDQRLLGRHDVLAAIIVAETVRVWLERGEGGGVGLLLRGVHASRGERNLHLLAGVLRGFLDRSSAAKNDQVGERDLLAAFGRGVEILLDRLELLERLLEFGRIVDLPVLLRIEANARAVASASLVGAAEGRGRRPGGRNQLGYGETGGEDLRLERRDVRVVDQRMAYGRNRILPDQRLLRDKRAEIANPGPHVAVGQLEPGAGERVGELIRMLVEA